MVRACAPEGRFFQVPNGTRTAFTISIVETPVTAATFGYPPGCVLTYDRQTNRSPLKVSCSPTRQTKNNLVALRLCTCRGGEVNEKDARSKVTKSKFFMTHIIMVLELYRGMRN